MKKLYLLIFCVGLITSLHGQPFSRESMHLSPFMGYPLSMGDNNEANKLIAFNKLLSIDVELEPMDRFQIGAIPDRTVWHAGDVTVGFYVLTDTLQVTPVQLSYSIDAAPKGKIVFNERTGLFKYFPDKADVRDFTVIFTAQSGSKMIIQNVKFTVMAATPIEFSSLSVRPRTMPAFDDYTIITDTRRNNVNFNNSTKTVYSYSISGKELVFDSNIANTLHYLSGREDIEELNLFAEKLIIRDALRFPQTNVTIYAKELVFEDKQGVIASISTSPAMWDMKTDGIGATGANAGNITLYIKDFKHTKAALRFIQIGGKGQDANRNGTPGKGGNGGTLTSTIDVNGFSDKIHGSAGAGYDVDGKTMIKAGEHGTGGKFTLHNKEFTWLHPNFVSAVVKHAKDAYINIQNQFTYNIFVEYSEYLTNCMASTEWVGLDEALKMELTNAQHEMQAVTFRIGQNLDYFGNPAGWVPMLSFEVNRLVFEQEIEKAISVMYLNYWMKDIDSSYEERINACNEAIKLAKQSLADDKALLNSLVFLIPELQDETAALQLQIEDLIRKIEIKKNQLLAQAKNNVKKRNRLNKTAGIFSAIAKAAPVVGSFFGPIGTAIGSAVGGVASIGANVLSKTANASDTYGYADAVGGFIDKANTELVKNEGFENIKEALGKIDPSSLGSTINTVSSAFSTIGKTVAPLMESIGNLHKVFAQSSTPSDQVAAELNKLMAESKEFQGLKFEAEVLEGKKVDVLQKLANTFNGITTTGVEVQKTIVSIDGLSGDVFKNNSKRDLRAMQYLDDMERRARERLLKYHYYMAKSYEYRLLEEYPNELNLTKMFDKFKEIAKADPNKKVLTSTDFRDLKVIYEDALSIVKEAIIDRFNIFGASEYTSTVSIPLADDELEALNSGSDVIINFANKGLIYANRENLRIVGLKVKEVKAHAEGTQGSIDNFTLKLEHSGVSMLRQNGEFYYFNHINPEKKASIQWSFDYEGGAIKKNEVSAASTSLISSLLGVKAGETMIYSRPGVWADIRISKDALPASKKMVLESLVFELEYDYAERPTNNRNLDVYALGVDGSIETLRSADAAQRGTMLMPYIEVSKSDRRNRANGRSLMYRTYTRDTEVTLTAPKEYGRYQFVNWTDRDNKVVSSNLSVDVRMANDVSLRANYLYTGAMLKAADTIYISQSTGFATVKIENLGSKDMFWTAVSNNSWLQITDGKEGIDDGYISLAFDENPLETKRIGTLTITTEEGESATVYVVQQELSLPTGIYKNALSSGIKIYPNPTKDKLYIESNEVTQVLVTDALGRFIYHTIIVDAGSISTVSWNSGVYFVTLKTADGNSVHKIVKK